MDGNRNNPNNNINEQTRQIPAQRSDSNTRQIPVQQRPAAGGTRVPRPVPQSTTAPAAKSADSNTRQIPVQQRPAAGGTRVPRPVPQGTTAPAAKGADSNTRQIPVQQRTAAGGTRVPRPVPQGTTDPATKGADLTRQIPLGRRPDDAAAKPATPNSANADKVKVAAPVDLSSTRQVKTAAVDRMKDAAKDNSGTKVMNTAVGEEISESKKRRNSKKNDSGDNNGNTIISIVKAIVYIVSVLIVSVTASIFIILVSNDMFAFVKSEEVVEITVPEGADISDIASILSDSGIIKYPSIFEWYADHNEDDGKFIAGNYSIACNTDYEDLLASFKEQVDEGTSWITIPEGYTTDEIIDLLVDAGIGTKEKYIDTINNYPFDYWFVQELDESDWKDSGRIYRLDGYLFPDTYEFYNKSSEKTVIGKLLARFNTIYGKKYKEATETMGMTADEIVIIASMIEKEAGQAADYHLVSSVFHNRLASPYYPKLESDATALYAIHHDTGERPTDVTGEHMQYETPYNTYLYEGLPPGPIANPSASSINAALTPEESNYYYFVSHGVTTYFSQTKAEHDARIEEIKEMIAKANGNQQG